MALALGIVLVPVVLEVLLRVGAAFVQGDRAGTGQALVVCQGDSNTFGLHLDADEAYPGQLETLLREHGVADARVVNRGVPGKPSWVVRNELVDDLERYQPKAVVVLVGVNDRNQVRPDDSSSKLLERSRFVRMVRRTWSNVRETSAVEEKKANPDSVSRIADAPKFAMVWGTPDGPSIERWTRESLRAIVDTVRDGGAKPILLTYFDDFSTMEFVTKLTLEVGAQTGARVVDLREVMKPALKRFGRDGVEYPDAHLRSVGYAIVARAVFNALVDEHVIDAAPIANVLEPLDAPTTRPPKVELWNDEGRLRGVRIEFQPGLTAQLMLSNATGAATVRFVSGIVRPVGKQNATARVKLARGELLNDSARHATEYTVQLDATGNGRIELLPATENVTPLVGCVVFVDANGEILTTSSAIQFR
ncbi:MAG: SGNH/GDSL hydrolase family protein [Planctomycetes bacterium]|nr:SGNH/GDSL hydrolase family protein [Planctomycetota bacterium]